MDPPSDSSFVTDRIVSAVKADTLPVKLRGFGDQLLDWISSRLQKIFDNVGCLIPNCDSPQIMSTYSSRLAELFSGVVINKQLPINTAVSLIWKYVGQIELLRSDAAVLSSDDPIQCLLGTAISVREFFVRTLELLSPILKHFGATLVDELVASKFVQRHLPHLVPGLTGSDDVEQYADRRLVKGRKSAWSTVDSSIQFKLPESFTIPFNEETDNRNNYKSSQMEVSIYNERQTCLDRIKAIFREYERQPSLSHFKESLLPQCISLLTIKDCNIPYLADIFMRMILFYGLKGASASVSGSGAASIITPTIPASFAVAASRMDSLESRLSGAKPSSSGFGGSSVSLQSRPSGAGESTIGFGASAVPAAGASTASLVHAVGGVGGGGNALSYANMAKVNQLSKRLGPDLMPPPGLTVNTTAANASAGFGAGASSTGFGVHGTSRTFASIALPPPPASSSGFGSNLTAAAVKTSSTPYSTNSNTSISNTPPTSSSVSGYDVYARVASNKKTPTQSGAAEPDLFEAPSAEFPHLLLFFFRFLVHADSFRFNCCLIDAITAEIMSLLKPEGNNRSTGSGASGHNNSGSKLTLRLSSSVDFSSLSPENFAMLVCKLRLLGKFLGLLRNYPRWTLTADVIQSKTLLQQSAEIAEKQLQLSYTLPIESLLEQSYSEGTLSLYVSWMTPYFKMSQWDSSAAHCSGHNKALDCLLSVLNSPLLSMTQSDRQSLSSNRLYVLMELQSLLKMQRPEYSIAPFSLSSGSSNSKLSRSGIDDGNQSFSTWFLHHVTPDLEVPLNLLRQKNKEAVTAAVASPAHKISPSHLVINNLPVKPKQRAKTPLETVAENSVSILSSHPTCMSPTLSQTLSSPKHATTPNNSSALNVKKKKSGASSSSGGGGGMTSLNSSTDSIHSLTAVAGVNGLNQQFHSISTPNKIRPIGITRSISTPTKSPSPRKTRSSSNTMLSSLARMSPSPIKRRASSLTESLYDAGETALANIQLTDIKDRLETAFWEQHQRLQKVAELSLDHAYHACRAHIKEQSALYAQELIAHISTLKIAAEKFAPETKNDHFKASIQEHMQEFLPLALSKGKKFIENFYANFIETVLPALCVLYPVQERVVGLAIRFATEQSQEHKYILLRYFQEYCQGKFKEMCDVVIRQYANEHHGRPDVIVDAEGSTVDLKDDSEQSAARSAVTSVAEEAPVWSLATHQSQLFDFVVSLKLHTSWVQDCQSLEALSNRLKLTTTIEVGLLSVQSVTQFRNSFNCLLTRVCTFVGETTLYLSQCRRDSIDKRQISLLLPTLSQLLCVLILMVSEGVTTVVDSHCESIGGVQELRGKTAIEMSKFLTSIIPHLIFLDHLYFCIVVVGGEANDEQNATLNCMIKYFVSVNFPSDLVGAMTRCDLLSQEGLSRLLPSVLKAKTSNFYESCKHLTGLKEYVNEGVLFLVGRLFLSRKMMPCVSDAIVWYKDVSVMDLIRSTESESLVKLINGLSKSIH